MRAKKIEGIEFVRFSEEFTEIKLVKEQKKHYLELLLLGDEQESMIDRYLEEAELFVWQKGAEAIAVACVTDEGAGVCELKNLAVKSSYQRKGFGKRFLNYLFEYFKNDFRLMLVGTGESKSTMAFYESCGFRYSHRVKNFFLENYDHLIFEDGCFLRDMVFFKKELKTAISGRK